MEWIQQNWLSITAIIGAVVTLASVIVKITPTPDDDSALEKVISVLNVLALNPKR